MSVGDEAGPCPNGHLLFAGDNTFQSRDPSFLGITALGPDAIYVDLRPGPNEIVPAVSEKSDDFAVADETCFKTTVTSRRLRFAVCDDAM